MPRYYRNEKEFEDFEHSRLVQIWGPNYRKCGRVLDAIATEVHRRNVKIKEEEEDEEGVPFPSP